MASSNRRYGAGAFDVVSTDQCMLFPDQIRGDLFGLMPEGVAPGYPGITALSGIHTGAIALRVAYNTWAMYGRIRSLVFGLQVATMLAILVSRTVERATMTLS